MQNIANKVVIITGASSGIGEATAYKLAREGAKIVLGARREDKLKAIADQIKADGGEAVYRVTDVVKPEDNAALVALAKEAFGKVDVIFLNAGLMPSSPLSALETANWNAMIDVNIKGVLNGIAAVLPEFNSQKSGHIITTSSVAGLKAYPGAAVYCGTKWAGSCSKLPPEIKAAMVIKLRVCGASSASRDQTCPNSTSSFSSANFGANVPRWSRPAVCFLDIILLLIGMGLQAA